MAGNETDMTLFIYSLKVKSFYFSDSLSHTNSITVYLCYEGVLHLERAIQYISIPIYFEWQLLAWHMEPHMYANSIRVSITELYKSFVIFYESL